MAKKDDVMVVDPSMEFERMLSYKEKQGIWVMYQTLFWSIYLLSEAILLIKYVPEGMSVVMFSGWSLVMLALFTIIFGVSVTLHLKLMKRYG